MEEIYKVCTKCLLNKPLSDYANCKRGLYKKQPKCKDCNRLYREQNREKIIDYLKNYYEDNKEYLTEQNKIRTQNNKEEVASYKKQWYFENIEKIKASASDRYLKNIESIKTYKKEYYDKNKEQILLKSNIRKKKKLKEDNLYNLYVKISSTIRTSLKRKKSKRTSEILGCTTEEFKAHIESQFLSWMSWDNYGNVCETLDYNCSWDLDHIIPISLAENEEEMYLLNHWSNFQPLCSKVNRWEKKGNIYPCTNLELKITYE